MAHRDALTHIRQMQDYATEARDLAAVRSRSDLDSDRVFGLAVWKLLDLVSVSAGRVSVDFRARHPSVAWDKTRGFRNRLVVDGYGRSDCDAAWGIIQNEIPPLVDALDAMLAEEGYRDAGG